MGCGCSKSEVVDNNNQQHQEETAASPQKKTIITKKIIKKKKQNNEETGEEDEETTTKKNDQEPHPASLSKNKRPPPPKTSPFSDSLLKNLPWHSIRAACDEILDLTSPKNSFQDSFETLLKFRSTCGLFYFNEEENNNS